MDKEPPPHVKDLIKFFSKSGPTRRNPSREAVKSPPPTSSTSPLTTRFEYNIRKPTRSFHGRKQQITNLHKLIQDHKKSGQNLTVVSQSPGVHPLGGVGKTELVRQYIENHNHLYSHLIWIDARDGSTLRKDFKNLAHQLGCLNSTEDLPCTSDLELVSKIYSTLQNSKSLIIFDNAEALEIIQFLPPEDQQGKPLILLINAKELNWSEEPLLLEGLTPEDGAEMLKQALALEESDEPLAKMFSDLSDGLPLALQIAVPLIDIIPEDEESGSNFLKNFVEKFATEQEQYLNRRLSDATSNITTAVLLQIAEKEMQDEEHGSVAMGILRKLAFIYPTINKHILEHLFPEITPPSRIIEAMELLVKYNIIADVGPCYEIHGHIQTIIIELVNMKTSENNNQELNKEPHQKLNQETILLGLASSILNALQAPQLKQILKQELIQAGLIVVKHMRRQYSKQNFLKFAEFIGNQLAKVDYLESYTLFQDILDFHIKNLSNVDEKLISQTAADPNGLTNQFATTSHLITQPDSVSKVESTREENHNTPGVLNLGLSGEPLSSGQCSPELIILQQTSSAQDKMTQNPEQTIPQPSVNSEKMPTELITTPKDNTAESIRITEPSSPVKLETQVLIENPLELNRVQDCKKLLKEILESEEEPAPKKLAANQILGHILNMQGKYEKAVEIFQEVAKIQRKFWGSQHLEYLTTQNSIATLMIDLREYEQAFLLYSEIHGVFKLHFGADHPFTVTVLNNLAVALHLQAKYDEALETYKEVLYYQEKLAAANDQKNDVKILRTKNNIAVILELQGSHEEVLEMYLQIFEEQLEILGTSHPDTLTTAHNVASVLDLQGKFEEALKIYTDVYQGRKFLLGDEHPDTLSTYHNMALLNDKSEDYAEALEMYKQVYAGRSKILGQDHKDTLNTLYNMAVALENGGNSDEALRTYSKVHELLKDKLGEDHPATFYLLHNMALVLENQERYQEAFELCDNTYERQCRVLGKYHQEALDTRHEMATVLEAQGNYKDAYAIYLEVYTARKDTFGENHPDSLRTLHKMASILECLQSYGEASEIYSQVLEKQMQVLGREHVTTLATESNKSLVEFHQKNYTEALEMYKKVYEIRQRVLGPVHPETLSTQHNIGLVLATLGNLEEAGVIFEDVYENRKDILGEEHLDTLRTRQSLAQVLRKQNKHSESLDILTQVYSSRKKLLGDQHPETVSVKSRMKAIYKAQSLDSDV